jgi:putative DNA-invertase from lambdoid prophage Rac
VRNSDKVLFEGPAENLTTTAPEASLLKLRAHLGRKPSFTRTQFAQVRDMLSQEAVGVARIAKETSLTRQTVYRIKEDPATAEAALVAWGL